MPRIYIFRVLRRGRVTTSTGASTLRVHVLKEGPCDNVDGSIDGASVETDMNERSWY